MTWGAPLWFLAVVLLTLVAVARWAWIRRLRQDYAGVGAGIAHLTPAASPGRRRWRAGLFLAGLALTAVALAQPRWGAAEQVRQATGCDVLVAIDCSRSMLATDLYPNRMEVARRKALDLLRLAPETRLAVLPFAAMPVLRCPLTGDRNALGEMLQDCSPELFPADAGLQGTAIGAAVEEGLRVLGTQVERGQAVLVLSDGDDGDTARVQAAAEAAKKAGIPVYGLFLGDAERTVDLEIDGRKERMTASRTTLDTLATATGGISVNAVANDQDLEQLHAHLQSHVRQGDWQEQHRQVASERYQWALLPGLLLLALAALLPTRRRVP